MTADTFITVIASILIALIAGTPGYIALRNQSIKDKAAAKIEETKLPQEAINAGITASSAAADVIRQYSAEIKDVRNEIKELREEIELLRDQLDQRNKTIEEWKRGIDRLIGQMTSLDIIPVWRPKAEKEG